MLIATTSELRLYDTDRWVLATPSGHTLLLPAPTVRLFHLLRSAPDLRTAHQHFTREFELALTRQQFHALVFDRFGGYQLVHGDTSTPRPSPGQPIKWRLTLLSPRLAGYLAAPLRGLFQPVCFWALAALLTLGLAGSWPALRAAPVDGLGALVLLVYLSVVVHELGHIAACQRAGVPHGGIGVGLYGYVIPVLYADITAIWLASRAQRIIANLAGIFAQLLFAAGLALAYAGWGSPSLALAATTVVVMAAWQLNPFLRSDGYWLLSDLTRTPNLMEQAKRALWQGLCSGGLRGKQVLLAGYGLANLGVFIGLTLAALYQYGPAIWHFPLTIATLLGHLITGTFTWHEVTRTHFLVLAFYVFWGGLLTRAVADLTRRFRTAT